MDISLERHPVDIDHRGLKSINRARAFLHRELLKNKPVCLRQAFTGEEDDEVEEGEDAEGPGGDLASAAASTTLLQDIESARELFFVVEERSRVGATAAPAPAPAETGPGAAASPHATHKAAGNSAWSPSSLRRGGEDAETDHGSRARDALRQDGVADRDGGDSARATTQGGDYSIPYWAILRVGELTNDPGVTPEPWPLHGVSNGGATAGQQGASLAVSRPQLPPPSQVHRPPNVPESVGYRIVVINVKVSIHHPRGSSVAANKDAVIDCVTRVRERQIAGKGGRQIGGGRREQIVEGIGGDASTG